MRRSIALFTTALAVAACGADSDDVATGSPLTVTETADPTGESDLDEIATVTIARSRFEPTEVSVTAGATVRFVNTDPYAHTVAGSDADSSFIDSGNLSEDAVYEVQFDEAGTFAYFCEIHPTMRATVVVG